MFVDIEIHCTITIIGIWGESSTFFYYWQCCQQLEVAEIHNELAVKSLRLSWTSRLHVLSAGSRSKENRGKMTGSITELNAQPFNQTTHTNLQPCYYFARWISPLWGCSESSPHSCLRHLEIGSIFWLQCHLVFSSLRISLICKIQWLVWKLCRLRTRLVSLTTMMFEPQSSMPSSHPTSGTIDMHCS